MTTLFTEYDEDTDLDVADYPALEPDHEVLSCRCGRLMLARKHLGERQPAYTVADGDALPPVQFGWLVRVLDGRPHRVPVCVSCYKAERQRRRNERYAV